MKFFSETKTIIIILLFGVIIWLSQCGGSTSLISFGSDCPEIRDTIITVVHDTVYPDTVYKKLVVEKLYPVNRILREEKVKYVQRGDSALIDSLLEDYYALYVYEDTLSDDSVEIIVQEVVTENRIEARDIRYRLLYPVISTTKESLVNYVHKRRNKFYIGGVFGPALPNEIGFQFGLKATFVGKKNYMVGLSFNRLQSANLNTNFLLIEYSRLISFRRKSE